MRTALRYAFRHALRFANCKGHWPFVIVVLAVFYGCGPRHRGASGKGAPISEGDRPGNQPRPGEKRTTPSSTSMKKDGAHRNNRGGAPIKTGCLVCFEKKVKQAFAQKLLGRHRPVQSPLPKTRLETSLLQVDLKRPSRKPFIAVVRLERLFNQSRKPQQGRPAPSGGPPPWGCPQKPLVVESETHVFVLKAQRPPSLATSSASGTTRCFRVLGHWQKSWNSPHCGASSSLLEKGDFNGNRRPEWMVQETILPSRLDSSYLGTDRAEKGYDLKQQRVFVLELTPQGLRATLTLRHPLTPRVDEMDQTLCGRSEGRLTLSFSPLPKEKKRHTLTATKTSSHTCHNPYYNVDSCDAAGLSEEEVRECEKGCRCKRGKVKRTLYRWDSALRRWAPKKKKP